MRIQHENILSVVNFEHTLEMSLHSKKKSKN